MINLCGANANKSFCVAQRKSFCVAQRKSFCVAQGKSSFAEQKSSFVEQKKNRTCFLGCFSVVFGSFLGLFFVSWESKNNKTKSHLFLVLARNQVIPQWDRGGYSGRRERSPRLCFALIKTMSLESPPNFPVGGILEFPGVGNLSGAK